MAHRIYIYNANLKTKETYPSNLAEWNYEIPILMRPLFSANIRSKGSQLFANKEDGIARLRYFYTLLADRYQLHYKRKYFEPVNRMFEFLEALPFDTFQIDGRDVFSMNAEKDTQQAKDWAEEIKMQALLYEQAVDEQSLDPLDPLVKESGYASFLDVLQTDWIDYGLGLWAEELLREKGAEVFEAEGKQGLKNAKGDLLIPAVYDEIFEFNEQGIAVVERNGQYGYIHASGAELVGCQYKDAYDARHINGNNYAEVEVSGKRGVLHIETKQLSIPAISGELLLLFKGDKLFRLDMQRNIVEIPETEFGYLYTERYQLQGRDQSYFVQFYHAWTKRKGDGYEQYFDNDTLLEKGKKLDAEGKISDAIRLLMIAADRGSADCQYFLGNIYTDVDYEGMDIAKGKSFYEQAMAQNHAQAWNNWAFLYATAHGVKLDIPKALKGYQQAAALGEAQAMSNLGNWYYEGIYVEQDYALALDYFKQAEKAGIANDAQMAEIYYQRQDYANLLRYLKRDTANQFAAIYYGILYEEGLGVKQSLSKAIRYYEQANEENVYAYAVNRLLQLYAAHGAAANADKYEFWLHFAKENAVEIDQ